MFSNLGRDRLVSAAFRGHNFSECNIHPVPDPSFWVEEMLREALKAKPNIPEPDLIPILSFTLSSECCKAFLDRHPELLITDRSYYLSKLYQFFVTAFLDEGDQTADEDRPAVLEQTLDAVFPNPDLPALSQLNWELIFDDYKRMGVLDIVRHLPSYLLSGNPILEAVPVVPEAALRYANKRRPGETLGNFIDRCRQDKSIEKISEDAKLDPSTIHRLKSGSNSSRRTLGSLAKALKCSISDLSD